MLLKRMITLIALLVACSLYAQADKASAQIQTIRKETEADVRDALARQTKEAGVKALDINKSFDIGNGVKLELAYVPSGKFFMGEEQFPVKISAGFYLGKYEVTQEQWTAVMGSNPATKVVDPSFPVETVSWNDCKKFLEKLNEKLKDQLGGAKFRLPTEAEWEYACRAGTSGEYNGDELDTLGWYDGNSDEATHRVGGKKANGWGLYDMHGNVWEWCHDYYGDYSMKQGLRVDPEGPSGGGFRVARGGSWADNDDDCRSESRDYSNPDDGCCYGGFRLLLTVPAKK